MTGKFLTCILDAAKGGEISRVAAARAQDVYREAYAASGLISPEEADRFAGRVVIEHLEEQAARAKQLRALSMRSRRRVLEGIAGLKGRRGYGDVAALGGKGGQPPKDGWAQGGTPPADGPGSGGAQAARALELIVENKPGLAGGPFASIEGRYRAVRGQLDAQMAGLVEAFETRTGFDAPGRATLDNVVREAFGEDSGDKAAKGLAEAWAGAAETARKLFNQAGGEIGKLDGWGLPQWHDPVRARAVGREAWVAAKLPRLARDKMIDRATGQPFSEPRLAAVLSEIYDTIVTGGANKREPGDALGLGMLANRRQDARFLIYNSADAWLADQAEFGAGDPFGIMMGHLDEMARDIARMQVLGPNPDHQFDWLANFALREAKIEEGAGVKGAAKRAETYVRTARNMMDHFTGSAATPEREWLAQTGATVRAYLTGAQLGSAILSDLPSAPVFGAYARAFTGLSKIGDVGQLAALIASPQMRAQARRSGFILEQATDGLVRGAQESLRLATVGTQVDGRGFNAFARRLPAFVFRSTGLNGWTQARKRSFRLEFMGALADRRGKSLADLRAGDAEDQAFAQLLEARGFSEAQWAAIGRAPLWSPASGADFLRPLDIIDKVDAELGYRVAEMIELQVRQAVPETTLWTRAKLLGADRPGTLAGEFRRSWAMFRSFTLTATHLYAEDFALRGLAAGGPGAMLAATGAAAMLISLTMAGAIAIQIREIFKGNDPRDMTTPEFWAAAMLQGGGVGILGDFFYAAESRAGKSSAMTGWGPGGAAVSDTWNATGVNVADIVGELGEGASWDEAVAEADPGRDAANLVRRYNPLASVWWSRAVMDRAVIDQLQRLVDPEAEKSFRDRARRLEREYGQGQWWPSGELAPERAPDFAGAFEGDDAR